jgi:hypothetical protein
MPTEQERPGMYARSSKAPSKTQLVPVTGKIVNSRRTYEVGWDENLIEPRPSTETSRSRSVAQQGVSCRQERRVDLHATEDVPSTRGLPEPIWSLPMTSPTRFSPAELQLPHPRSMTGTTLQRPSNHSMGSNTATQAQHISARSRTDSFVEDYTDPSKLSHPGASDQEATMKTSVHHRLFLRPEYLERRTFLLVVPLLSLFYTSAYA